VRPSFRLPPVSKDTLRINRRIKVASVSVIDDEGTKLGEFTVPDAIELAEAKGLDLVEVAPKSKPPVCRLMDYGKYKYKKNKKAHEAKKNQRIIKLKEIKLTPRTSEHDYNFKLKHIIKFLNEGSKVKVTVFFRGRQISHPEMGRLMLDKYIEDTKEFGNVIQDAKIEGRTMTVVLESKTKGLKKPPAVKTNADKKSDVKEEDTNA